MQVAEHPCPEAARGHGLRAQLARLAWAALASWLASGGGPACAQASPPSDAVHLADHGGVCDGVTDNSPALARALASAREKNLPLLIPKGQCAFADIIRVDGVTLTGFGESSVLHALNWRRAAIFMSGASPVVSHLKLTGLPAPARQAPWEMTKITVFGATDFVIDHVTIDGSAAAGIQTARGATRGRITHNIVRNTLSDGIHLTGGASQLLVEGNLVEGTGDDGIAVVSYWTDAVRVNHITARNNVVRNNRFGRNMSVVGGAQVLYENNLLQNNQAGLACLYVAQENRGMPTQGSSQIRIERNTLENCGGRAKNHGAMMIFSDGRETNDHIWLRGNDIRQSPHVAIRVFSPWNLDVRLENNRITDAPRAPDVSGPSVNVVPYDGGPVGYAGS